jgi:hypothetical protein
LRKEEIFHLSGKVNRNNIRMWGSENPDAMVEHFRKTPNVRFLVL